MTNLTANEMKVLKSLAFNHYGDGRCTWAWATNESSEPSGIVGKELSGVISSLAKKGLVRCINDGADSTIDTTEAGITEMNKNGWNV